MIDFSPLPADNRILFFRRDRALFGFLSHFHAAPITLDDLTWPTLEHFYQAHKSLDPRYRAAIRACESAGHAKRLAATPASPRRDRGSWFQAHHTMPRTDWAVVKGDIMRRGEIAKYQQNPDLAARLLATGDAELVEDSRSDDYWGIGRNGQGENWAGRIIMEVRERLRAQT